MMQLPGKSCKILTGLPGCYNLPFNLNRQLEAAGMSALGLFRRNSWRN